MDTGPQITPVTCFDCNGLSSFDGTGLIVAILLGVTLRRWQFAFPLALILSVVTPLTGIATRAILYGDTTLWFGLAYSVEQSYFWLERAVVLGMFLVAILAARAAVALVALVVRGEVARVFASLTLIAALFFGFVAIVELSGRPASDWATTSDPQGFTFTELYSLSAYFDIFAVALVLIAQLALVHAAFALAQWLLTHRSSPASVL